MRRTHAAAAAIAAAGLTTLVSSAFATTLFTTSFETSGTSYTIGASIKPGSGWVSAGGTGTAVVASTGGLARTGTNYIVLTPPTSTGGNWLEKDVPWTGANMAACPLMTYGASVRFLSPTAGTANRTATVHMQTYNDIAGSQAAADFEFYWDAQNLIGAGVNHLLLFFDWSTDSSVFLDQGFGWDFGAFTSSQLSTLNYGGVNGYLDVSIKVDYSTGDVTFADSLNGVETEHGTIAVGTQANAFSTFNDADMFYRRFSTGGTLARTLLDDYYVNAEASAGVPEPASLGLLTVAAAGLIGRRRRS